MLNRPPQLVALAFDGSKNLDFWRESRKFARDKGIKFTYFISGVYFLADKDRKKYDSPTHGPGGSCLNFGGTASQIAERLEQVVLAHQEGHEIASHANGHCDGSSYTLAEWNSEHQQFTDILTKAWIRYGNGSEPSWWKSLFEDEIAGFRAPLLGVNDNLWKSLKIHGFKYDTSLYENLGFWPEKSKYFWNFPLAKLYIHGLNEKTLSMDYNFYYKQSAAKPGPISKYKEYEEQMLDTYVRYFNYNYYGDGNRAPIDIGHHFSQWNGGAYWKAMKRFTDFVLSKSEAQCVTYSEMAGFMERNPANLDDYRAGNFNKLAPPAGTPMPDKIWKSTELEDAEPPVPLELCDE